MSNFAEIKSLDWAHQKNKPYQVIRGTHINSYEEKVVQTYSEEPEHWRKAIGDTLLFQFGIYDDSILTFPSTCKTMSPLDAAGLRYFERQLHLADLKAPVRRILDIGCGWGFILRYLAERYKECQVLDGVNVSEQQLNYCAQYHAEQGLQDRIHLFQCNAQDVNLLPDDDQPYDLVIMRGVISHFPNDLFSDVMEKLWKRMSPGGTVIISDNLYNLDLATYHSETKDDVDRLACAHRKTPEYFLSVLKEQKFIIDDCQVLPEKGDAIKWLQEIRDNIVRHFPDGVTGALDELRVMSDNLVAAITKNKFSIYSIILKRP